MKKLYRITVSSEPFYFGAKSLKDVVEFYPSAKVVEFIDDKLLVNESNRSRLLEKAFNFINNEYTESIENTYKNKLLKEIKEELK